MPNFDDAYRKLAYPFEKIFERQKDLNKDDDYDVTLKKEIEEWKRLVRVALTDLVRFPPHHERHFQTMKQFHPPGNSYERSVFIMTKFYRDPPPAGSPDESLKKVIDAVRKAVADSNFVPRIALGYPYDPILWLNVEAHLLGCGKGIAILEDKYAPELNPNVACELGWMRGMGKDILYLVEKDFKHDRADWSGFLMERFAWDDIGATVVPAVTKWLAGPQAQAANP